MSSVRTITIPEKHYNNDPAKAKVHDMLGEMLDTTLLTFRKPSEIKVLHFAGIDAQETKAVYLSRGIPPQNITTLERDPEIAKVQESLGLGIVVINKTIEEYVKEQTSNNRRLDFNVVSLDFTSPLTKSGIGFMSYIKDKIMHNYLLFHSANLLRREANSRSAYSRISSVCVEHNNANLDKPK